MCLSAITAIYTLSLHDALPIFQDSWASSEIQTVVGIGLIEPLPNHTFRPAAAITRAEFETRSEEHTSELQSRFDLVCRLLLEKKKENRLPTSTRTNRRRYGKTH